MHGKQYNKGFTLIEIIISVAMLSIICAVMLQVFAKAALMNRLVDQRQSAELCTSSVLETILCSDTIENGFAGLGIDYSDGKRRYKMDKDEFDIEIYIETDRTNEYGKLFSITVKGFNDQILLSEVSTKKYEQVTDYD